MGFRGFVDAEGCFMVPKRKQGFGFRLDIKLHIDDKDVLNYIKHMLGIGNVYILKSSSSVLFSVISRAELLFIICIFSKYNLNTTKHLNFLAFAKAFLLYDKDSNREYRKSVKPLIIDIISSINFKRNNYNLPITHKINITSS